MPSHRAPASSLLLLRALLAPLAVALGCGSGHDGSPGYGAGIPPGLERFEWTAPSIDAIDGHVRSDGRVEIRSGLEVTDGGAVAFVAFDVSTIPLEARVLRAELVLWTEDLRGYGGPVDLLVTTVDYGPGLDSRDVELVGFDSRSFPLGPGARGTSLVLDLTGPVSYEIESGVSTVGLRLDAFGGDLLFEDGGSNLGTGAPPLLFLVYEW